MIPLNKVILFQVGEKYVNATQLRECLTYYALANGFSLWLEKSSPRYVIARCGLRPERVKNQKKGKTSKWKQYPSAKKGGVSKCPWR